MLEKSVEKYFCRRVRDGLQGLPLKFVSPGFAGVPDRIVLLPGGRVYFVELKAPGRHLRMLQKRVRMVFRLLDINIYTIDSKEAVDAFLREVVGCGV